MASQEEIAEIRQLQQEIRNLQNKIIRASEETIVLEGELAFIIAAIGILTTSAEEMGEAIIEDAQAVSAHVAQQDVDVRDLLQELRDLSDRYFTYKNLSTATKNVTQFTDEYYTRFGFFQELRRISLGCVMAVDRNLISHETAREKVEKAYLANTDYWLAYAISAVMLWWSDEREASERAMKKALSMDRRKSSLLFLFSNLKFGRVESAAKWYAYYLDNIRANALGEEYQYLLEAYLSGSFADARMLETLVSAKLHDMMADLVDSNINFNQEVSDAALRFLCTKAHLTEFPFFYLTEYCDGAQDMKRILTEAEKNSLVVADFEGLAEQASREDDWNAEEHLEDSIYNLLESMDEEEEKVFKRIKYNELVVAAKGDITIAEAAYAERYLADEPNSLDKLLLRWAFTEDDPRILPEVRRFAIGKLVSGIRAGFKRHAETYRSEVQDRYQINLEGWSMSCSENDHSLAEKSYTEYFKKHQVSAFAKDKFFLIWAAMIGAGLLGLLLCIATGPVPTLIVVSMLLVLVGAFLMWRQVDNIQKRQEAKRLKDLEIIDKTLDEMGAWRRAYKEADAQYESLFQATYLFEE